MGTTYHVQHRYGFVGDYDDVDKVVIDARDAVVYSRGGAIRLAVQINERLGAHDRKAQPVMLTRTGRVRKIHAREERLSWLTEAAPRPGRGRYWEVGDETAVEAGAPGRGRTVYLVTRVQGEQIFGVVVSDTVREMRPWEVE